MSLVLTTEIMTKLLRSVTASIFHNITLGLLHLIHFALAFVRIQKKLRFDFSFGLFGSFDFFQYTGAATPQARPGQALLDPKNFYPIRFESALGLLAMEAL